MCVSVTCYGYLVHMGAVLDLICNSAVIGMRDYMSFDQRRSDRWSGLAVRVVVCRRRLSG